MNGFHDVGDPYGLVPDHDGALLGSGVGFIEGAKSLVLEDCSEVFIAEEDEGGDVVVGVFVDGFEDGGVGEGDDVFGFDLWQDFIALHFVFLVEAEPVEASQVGSDKFFADTG